MMSSELQKIVALVRSVDGLYVITDDSRPGAVVPLTVNKGKIYSMLLDVELDPTRFIDGAKFTGPLFQFPPRRISFESRKVKAGSVEVIEP